MKCLMFGLACAQEQFDKYVETNKNPYSVAHYLFETELISNLEKYYEISHNYIFQSSNFNIREVSIQASFEKITANTKTTYLNFLNLPIFKFISMFYSCCKRIKQYQDENGADFFVLSTINYLPIGLATCFMARRCKYRNIIIFTDCSVGYAYDGKTGKKIKHILLKIYKKIVHILENQYDAYVLFSEKMNEVVNCKRKPYHVMEGFFNAKDLDLNEREKYPKFVILYAGSLLESFGIQNIIEAFQTINNKDMELWIAGDGPYKDKLMQLSCYDERIHFLGYVKHSKLFEIEKKVSMVINTRDPKLEYTKYSFPSKTFEYLVSGTPFLSTKLVCYPKEYDSYIYFIEDNSIEKIKQGICLVASKSEEERAEFGKKAREFIIHEKASEIQVKKLVDFITKITQY